MPGNPAMTDAAAMQELFANFQQFWRSGKDAHLSMECHAGQAWLQLRVHLPQPHQQQKPRRPGPSRIRRRARRTEARAVAEIAAATHGSAETFSKVVENDEPREKAVQANFLPPPQVSQIENVDDALKHPTKTDDAEKPTTKTTNRASKLNVNANPWPRGDVEDVFCPDQHYLQQLHEPQAPPNQCKFCGKTFGSSRALASHAKRDHST